MNKTLTHFLTSTNNNIHSVLLRTKIKNGFEIPGSECISFGVVEKKPLSALNADEILPNSITVDGSTYNTDVVQFGSPIPLVHQIESQNILSAYSAGFPGGTNQDRPYFFYIDAYPFSVQSYWPTGEHHAVQRPIRGGLGITGSGVFSNGYGTLGGIVRDVIDGSVVGLTNAHVANTLSSSNVFFTQYVNVQLLSTTGDINALNRLMHSPFSPYDRKFLYGNQPDGGGGGCTYFSVNSSYCAFQPFEISPGVFVNQNAIMYPYAGYPSIFGTYGVSLSTLNSSITAIFYNTDIGYVKRYMPITPFGAGVNYIDAALITLNSLTNVDNLTSAGATILSAGYSHQQANFNHKNICAFATTDEINGLVVNRIPLFKSGARSSATGWPNALSGTDRFSKNICMTRFGQVYDPNPSSIQYQQSGTVPYNWCFDQSMGLSALSVNASIYVTYSIPTLSIAPFENQIVIYNPNYVGGSGDSGSLLYGLFNANNSLLSAWKIVGLIFAGSPNLAGVDDRAKYMFANRIDMISQYLMISAFDGTNIKYTNLNNRQKIYTAGTSASAYIVGPGGRKYWQTGFRLTL